ncbi:hypothetical protein SMC26_14350 [Actinomadura fulvescens]|uniref:Uncharacterized protein n=1 Tax=Actinomadura fulvescens TaxID=46160 RepID=A0ABP6CCE4_9ACTN
MTSDKTAKPDLTAEQCLAMLDIIGARSPDAGTRRPSFLMGILLCFLENGLHGLDRTELRLAAAGYADAVVELTGGQPAQARRGWAVLINARLNRTAIELQEATEGTGSIFVDVAGPAMLVASNLMNVLNHRTLTEEEIRATVATAEGNLQTLHRNFDLLKDTLRDRGVQL